MLSISKFLMNLKDIRNSTKCWSCNFKGAEVQISLMWNASNTHAVMFVSGTWINTAVPILQTQNWPGLNSQFCMNGRLSPWGKTSYTFWSHTLAFHNTHFIIREVIKIPALRRVMADLLLICHSYGRIVELLGFSLLWEMHKLKSLNYR